MVSRTNVTWEVRNEITQGTLKWIMVHSFIDSYMLLFHLLRFLSGITIHYAACCGCHFVMLIFTAVVDVKKKFNTEGRHE